MTVQYLFLPNLLTVEATIGSSVEVKHAEIFLAVAEELHFGRAAERLRMAQPPLSRMIKQLERQLKADLFIRTTRTVELTSTGKALVEPARKLVAASQEDRKSTRLNSSH